MKTKQITACGGVVLTGLMMFGCCGGGIFVLSRADLSRPKATTADKPEADSPPPTLHEVVIDLQNRGVFGVINHDPASLRANVKVGPAFYAMDLDERTWAITALHYDIFHLPTDQALRFNDERVTYICYQDGVLIAAIGGHGGGIAWNQTPAMTKP
jgi:hypothetical protein